MKQMLCPPASCFPTPHRDTACLHAPCPRHHPPAAPRAPLRVARHAGERARQRAHVAIQPVHQPWHNHACGVWRGAQNRNTPGGTSRDGRRLQGTYIPLHSTTLRQRPGVPKQSVYVAHTRVRPRGPPVLCGGVLAVQDVPQARSGREPGGPWGAKYVSEWVKQFSSFEWLSHLRHVHIPGERAGAHASTHDLPTQLPALLALDSTRPGTTASHTSMLLQPTWGRSRTRPARPPGRSATAA